ncbi:hypothetical protein JCM16358_04690 [Halanaerocella petrolearia]
MKRKFLIFILLLLLTSYSGIEIFAIDKLISQPRQTNPENKIDNRVNKSKDNLIDDPLDTEKEKSKPDTNTPNGPTVGPAKKTEDGQAVITQPTSNLVLVNKERALPASFTPADLTIPDIPFPYKEDVPKKQVKPIVAKALEQLFTQAKKENIKLAGVSGYRSYQRQKSIFNYNVRRKGRKEANKTSAQPGESEHQTGLAIDVSSPSVNYRLVEDLGKTKAGKWLAENAAKYGFIIRYPQDKTEITGYQYEPWHLRYVGQKHALKISSNNLTLEEYLTTQNG